MQGRGITNFSADKPSHAITTATTEFDDALISRGIVTTEQVMLAKGASPEEAQRLAEEKRNQGKQSTVNETTPANNNKADDSDSDSMLDEIDNDDEFFARYRQERLAQLSSSSSDTVEHIVREDWSSRVNEASHQKWVLVTLLDVSLGKRRQDIVQELHTIARQYSSELSCLTIDSEQAIPNWPTDRVPSMFAYRNGIKQHEWIANRNGAFPTPSQMESLLQHWKILN